MSKEIDFDGARATLQAFFNNKGGVKKSLNLYINRDDIKNVIDVLDAAETKIEQQRINNISRCNCDEREEKLDGCF